jgi:hypothetical protein
MNQAILDLCDRLSYAEEDLRWAEEDVRVAEIELWAAEEEVRLEEIGIGSSQTDSGLEKAKENLRVALEEAEKARENLYAAQKEDLLQNPLNDIRESQRLLDSAGLEGGVLVFRIQSLLDREKKAVEELARLKESLRTLAG